MSFRWKLILSLALLLVPLVGSEAYFHYQHYQDNRMTALANQTELALDLSRAADSFVDRTVTVQRAVGQALAKSHWHSVQARRRYLDSVLASAPPLLQIVFADPAGRVVEAAPSDLLGLDVSDRDYFRRLRGGEDWAVSDRISNKICAKCGFIVATAIRDPHRNLLGVVISGVDEKRLLSVFHIQPPQGGFVVLVDTSGRLTFMSNRLNIAARKREWKRYSFVQAALRGRNQQVDHLALPAHEAMTGAILPVTSLGWAAGAFVPQERVIGPVRQSAMRDLAVTVFVLALTFLIGSVIAKKMVAPVEDLSDAAERLGRGELATRASVPNIAEFSSLARTMNQMAESIEQAYERERRISSVLQQRMLPEVPQKVGRVEIATGYFPRLEEAEIGGDFYDVTVLPGGLVGIVIAYVSGKGLAAAVHTAMAKYMLEGFASVDADPSLILSKLNKAMCMFKREEDADTFDTLFLAVVDSSTGRVSYANAGHPLPLLRRRDGSSHWLDAAPALPLGISDEAGYSVSEARLSDGDALVFYTDGVIEAHSHGRHFRPDDLRSLVQKADLPPHQLVRTIYKRVSSAVGGEITDDVALVVARLLPAA